MREEPLLDPNRVGDVLIHAAGLTTAEQELYLVELVAAEPELAAEVRRRLAVATDISSFLERPAAARLVCAEPDETDPVEPQVTLRPEERYELGRCLGQGGMGRVMEAYDHQLGRRVAIKMLTEEGARHSGTFLREGRAQARVHHGNVLDIYDSGELDGQPYLSMRLVDGGTLADIGPELSLEHRIRLLIQAAEGLHAAHREGLLHRDVKPANVLVEQGADGALSALVSDFGIATDLEEVTDLNSLEAGTPQFIAPERLLNPTAPYSRRSDVYSLGVTIFQVLTGSLPYSGPLTIDILRQAASEDPLPPRSVDAELPAEIEAIILRAMAREPSERYSSARAVAEDLQRYLDGEVVEAYAAGLAYRLTRFVLRNRLLVILATVALTSLLAASVAITVFALRADAARQQAETRQGQAEELIRFMVVDLQSKLEPVSRLAVLEDIGRAAMDYFAAVPREQLSQAELLRRSRMLYQLGELRIRQGDLADAAAPMEESLKLTQRLHELSPDNTEHLFELGQSWFWVGFVAWESGKLAAAERSFTEYLAVSRRLVDIDADHPTWQLELSYAESNLGSVLQAGGELETALARFRTSLAIKQRLVDSISPGSSNQSFSLRSDLADSQNTVAVALSRLGRLQETQKHFEQELAIRHALLDEEPENRLTRSAIATTYAFLAKNLISLGELEGAEAHAEEAHRLLQDLFALDPEDSRTRLKLVWLYVDLGRLALARQRVADAESLWRTADDLLDPLLAATNVSRSALSARGTLDYHVALALWNRKEPRAWDELQKALETFDGLAVDQPLDPEVARWWGWSYLLLASLEPSPAAVNQALDRAATLLTPVATAAATAETPDRPAAQAQAQAQEENQAENQAESPTCLEWARDVSPAGVEALQSAPLDPLWCCAGCR